MCPEQSNKPILTQTSGSVLMAHDWMKDSHDSGNGKPHNKVLYHLERVQSDQDTFSCISIFLFSHSFYNAVHTKLHNFWRFSWRHQKTTATSRGARKLSRPRICSFQTLPAWSCLRTYSQSSSWSDRMNRVSVWHVFCICPRCRWIFQTNWNEMTTHQVEGVLSSLGLFHRQFSSTHAVFHWESWEGFISPSPNCPSVCHNGPVICF